MTRRGRKIIKSPRYDVDKLLEESKWVLTHKDPITLSYEEWKILIVGEFFIVLLKEKRKICNLNRKQIMPIIRKGKVNNVEEEESLCIKVY